MIKRETANRVLDHIDADELIRLTTDLVRINSVWDPEAGTCEQPAAELAARWCAERGFRVEMDEVVPGRPNVTATLRFEPGRRNLMFEGHTDVVTPGHMGAWRYDPFGAEIVGRRMYGRGTNDTKGNLAAMLTAMDALKRSGVRLAGSITAGILCDEEGRMLGVQDFIRRGRADTVTAAVICEPEDGLICIAQKGAVRVRFTIAGRMAHGAMPLSGLNTAPAVAEVIIGLQRLETRALEIHGWNKLLGWPSITPTVIRAPAKGAPQLNVIPGRAEILVDIRTVPGQDHQTIRDDIQNLAREVESRVEAYYRRFDHQVGHERDLNMRVRVEFLTDRPCTHTDPEEPVVRAAVRSTREITGAPAEYAGVPGATDGTFLWALKDIPIVTMGAGDRFVPHQADEWVDLDQLIDTARIYALTALHYLWPGEAE